jgi:hypothetical protein
LVGCWGGRQTGQGPAGRGLSTPHNPSAPRAGEGLRGVSLFGGQRSAVATRATVSLTTLDQTTNELQVVGIVGLSAAILSVLTSLGSSALTDGGPSLTNSEVLPPATGGE